ncbi:MAG: hypothetical protein WBE26_09045 [Phycisphaerae bacterium]
MMAIRGPRFAVGPAGTTEAPALGRTRISELPAAQERLELVTRLDWAWIRAVLDAGEAVGIVVDTELADVGALIDAVQARLGFGLVLRLTDEAVLWVCRADALTWDAEG